MSRFIACLVSVLLVAACQTLTQEGLTESQIDVLRELGFQRQVSGWEFDLDGRILFGSDKAELSAENRATIARIVKVLDAVGIDHLRVEGYADSSGNKRHNEILSLRRAEAVAREIGRAGLPYENITVTAYGIDNPVADNATRAGRAQNRRVVIIVPVR
ncbi:MAG: OmpA family protein [Azoarcus sp.]|jgi:outer membrane protein OmpA-like peptidoglycan-associated protein|nr:OmpA family protein [Azoarcus sp.]